MRDADAQRGRVHSRHGAVMLAFLIAMEMKTYSLKGVDAAIFSALMFFLGLLLMYLWFL
jgi:hypothetical protein